MTPLADALTGVTKLGLDTTPFIYFVERHAAYFDLVHAALKLVDEEKIIAYSSVVTLTEVLTQPLRLGNNSLADEYRQLLLNARNLTLLPIVAQTAELAAELRARYKLRTPDALQVAAALDAGCEAFLCNDAGLRRVTELRVLILEELEL
ncbi:MAG: hypothetical protein QOE33_2268 [Acidobacteriota bacterium]|nr:hypothetical protein [Acidobacteriota bacterium]